MFTHFLRTTFKGMIDPTARFFGRLGFVADTLTLTGCLLNVGAGLIAASGSLPLAGLGLILASAFDALDGTLARQMGQSTRFGAFLDSVLDRISESAVLLGLAWYYMGLPGRVEEILIYVTLVGSYMVSYTRARAEGLGLKCEVGFFDRVMRCLVLIAALLFGLVPPALLILAVGTTLTTIQRIWHVYRSTRGMAL